MRHDTQPPLIITPPVEEKKEQPQQKDNNKDFTIPYMNNANQEANHNSAEG